MTGTSDAPPATRHSQADAAIFEELKRRIFAAADRKEAFPAAAAGQPLGTPAGQRPAAGIRRISRPTTAPSPWPSPLKQAPGRSRPRFVETSLKRQTPAYGPVPCHRRSLGPGFINLHPATRAAGPDELRQRLGDPRLGVAQRRPRRPQGGWWMFSKPQQSAKQRCMLGQPALHDQSATRWRGAGVHAASGAAASTHVGGLGGTPDSAM